MKICLKIFLALSLIAGVFLIPDESQAWNDDTHFYLTYYLSKKVGFDDKMAFQIAASDLYTDYHPWTEACLSQTHWGYEQKRLWHFPKWASFETPDTTRDNFFAQINLYNAFNSCDPILLGIALHAYQDSWSHEAYGFRLGHGADGHTPDMPYREENKIKAWETACKTYSYLKKFYALHNGQECKNCPDIESLKNFLYGVFEYNPGYTWQEWVVSHGHFDKALKAMCENWVKKWEYGKGDNFTQANILKNYEKEYGNEFEKRISFYGLPIGDKVQTKLDFTKIGSCSKKSAYMEMPVANTSPPNLEEYGSILNEGLSSVNLLDKMVKKNELYRLHDVKVRAAVSNMDGLQKIMGLAVRNPVIALELLYFFEPKDISPEKVKEILSSYLNSKEPNVRIVAAMVLKNDFKDDKAKQLLINEYKNASPLDKDDPDSFIHEVEKNLKQASDQPL